MKNRIVALILTVVMSLLALTSCGSFDFATENLDDYATFDYATFKAALPTITKLMKDGFNADLGAQVAYGEPLADIIPIKNSAAPLVLTEADIVDIAVNAEDLKVDGFENVFAAGDCVSGPATVVEAVAAGRKAALSAVDFFAGRKHTEPELFNVSRGHWSSLSTDDLVYLHDVSKAERVEPEFIPMELRKTTFTELFPTISAEKIMKEGERCIECSCTSKSECKLKKHSESLGVKPDMFKGERSCEKADTRHPAIIRDPRKCLRCGICVKICGEVVNQHLLAMMQRGFATRIGTAFGKELPLACKDCGKCIEECPVGALDWKIKA